MVTVCYFEATPGKLIVEFGLVESMHRSLWPSAAGMVIYYVLVTSRTVQTGAFEGDYSVLGPLGFDTVLFSAWILEHAATFFTVQGTDPHQASESHLLLTLHCRRWRQHAPLKCLYPLWNLHSVKTKYIGVRTVPTMKTQKFV
jgi:hypothetical protein